MKRDPALISLSGDHHQALWVALRLRRATAETEADVRADTPLWAPRLDQAEHGGVVHGTPRAAWSARIASRMSRIGSTERTRGMTSKLCGGGGEVVNHSSV
jgi:hypothetical protein